MARFDAIFGSPAQAGVQGDVTQRRAIPLSAPAFAGARSRACERGFTLTRRSAEHGFTPSRRSAEHGFTLVELMIVLVVLGLASAVVVLTLPSVDGGARAEATRFAARAATLRDKAVIEGRTMGLWATASGYGFEKREGGVWQPIEDRTLARADWRTGTAVSVDGGSQGRLSFDRVGLPDAPMTLAFTSGGSEARVTIDAAGEVAVR